MSNDAGTTTSSTQQTTATTSTANPNRTRL